MLFKQESFKLLNLTYDELIKQEESDLDEKFKNNKSVFEKKLKELVKLKSSENSFPDKLESELKKIVRGE